MRAIREELHRLRLDWQAGLRRLPFFTQRTAVLLLGVLVATLALLGGVVALIGPPRSGGPTHLVPGGQAGQAPASRPAPGGADTPAAHDPGAAAGADAGGPAAASPAPVRAGAAQAPTRPAARVATGPAPEMSEPGGSATEAQGSGGAAGAGAGGPPAAPPTTPPTTTTPQGPLAPLDDLLGPVVSTLLP